MKDLENKTAVVTGAASGIGLAISKALADEGMDLVLADISDAALDEAVNALRAHGTACEGVVSDVSREADLLDLRQQAVERFGNVHLVCNNAGVICKPATTWEHGASEWRRNLDVNLMGVVNGIRIFTPHLLDHGEPAHIVNVASLGGLIAEPLLAPYHAAKFAVVAVSESLYYELAIANTNVGVTVVCPGFVATNLLQQENARYDELTGSRFGNMAAEFEQAVARGLPPEDIARQTVAAVKTGKLHALTHAYSRELLEARFSPILDGENLPVTDSLRNTFTD